MTRISGGVMLQLKFYRADLNFQIRHVRSMKLFDSRDFRTLEDAALAVPSQQPLERTPK